MSPKTVAMAFTVLMFTSTLPIVDANHVDPLLPDVPRLPPAQPTDQCIPVGVQAEILEKLNQFRANDPAFYQDPFGVPSLCLNGQPMSEWQSLVRDFDKVLSEVRNASQEIQRQVDQRTEHTLPESNYPNDLVEPRTVLLEENFDGRRYTGFGDWKVVTDQGAAPLWRLTATDTVNGTVHTYRFGDDKGYERGVHQFLVSPEIDLTALKGNKTAVQDLEALRSYARSRVHFYCYDWTGNGASPNNGILSTFCNGSNTIAFGGVAPTVSPPALALLVDAYEAAFDQTIGSLPVMQHGAYLDIKYRFNMDPGSDGVRVWIYEGDRQPDRSVLFDPRLGRDAARIACVHHELPSTQGSGVNNNGSFVPNDNPDDLTAGDLACVDTLDGGKVIRGMPGMQRTTSFGETNVADRRNDTAFSGDFPEFQNVRFNLTDHMNQRIWLLFEVKTKRNDRGIEIFNDLSRFPRPKDYGFELGRIYIEGDGYHRNFRLKDVATTYSRMPAENDFGDSTSTKTTIPPGNDPLVVWVHNAGDLRENGTLFVTVKEKKQGSASFGSIVGEYNTSLRLSPDEVRSVRIPWGTILKQGTLNEGSLYEVNATLSTNERLLNGTTVGDQAATPPGKIPPLADPNATAVRPANAAGTTLGAGVLGVTGLVRAATVKNVTGVRADGSTGPPIQVCSAVNGRACDEHFAGRKGEPRFVLVGVRNDGNIPQDVSVTLSPSLGGTAKPDIILSDATKIARGVLPGEIRPVTWQVLPLDPGAYKLTVSFTRQNETAALDPNVERVMFVQRSTGLICLDTIEIRECGSSFEGTLVPRLREEDIHAAAFGPDGTLYVVTNMTEMRGDAHSGMLAARDPQTLEWRVLANLSPSRLSTRFGGGAGAESDRAWGPVRSIVVAPDSSIFLFGENSTALRYRASDNITRLRLNHIDESETVNFQTAIYYNGTILAGGHGSNSTDALGRMFYYHNGSMLAFQLNASNATRVLQRYNATVRSLATIGQDVVLGGDAGVVLRLPAGKNVTTGWEEVRFETGRPSAWTFSNASVSDVEAHAGHLYIVAGPRIYVTPIADKPFTSGIRNITPPPPVAGVSLLTDIEFTHDGALYVSYVDRRLATCTDCLALSPSWSFPEIARPPVITNGTTHLAKLNFIVAGASQTALLGEAGFVATLTRAGDYDNLLDWSVVSALTPRDGGVLQTRRSGADPQLTDPQSLIVVPDDAGRATASTASKYRLWMNHSVMNASNDSRLAVNLLYRNVPNFDMPELTRANIKQLCPPSQGSVGVGYVCENGLFRFSVASFVRPTARDGWEAKRYDDLPTAGPVANPAANATPGASPPSAYFWALELAASAGTRWALDDIRLEGLVGTEWRPIAGVYGVNNMHGDAYLVDISNSVFRPLNQPVPQAAGPLAAVRVGWETNATVFDVSPVSPWHITTQYADRPVFAANNEFYASGPAAPANPRLLSRWDSRLVSPIIDLSEAYDPAIEFSHTFSFRTKFGLASSGTPARFSVDPSDGGFVEISYELAGAECGTQDPLVTCGWSPFYKVHPDGGYTNRTGIGLTYDLPINEVDGTYQPLLRSMIGENASFWGRLAQPDERGIVTGPRATATYQPVRITLKNVECTLGQLAEMGAGRTHACVPTNVSGRQIRVGFHLMTVAHTNDFGPDISAWNYTRDTEGLGMTFPGEGWYISDFKVLGARKLGIDLAAKDPAIRVGYDVATIGVGPGTKVPVNLTVENRGTFDALGYTATLEIREVLDPATRSSKLVEAIRLGQQPVLAAGKSVNHTIVWEVPRAEGKPYLLQFRVDPLGIGRDENFLDNAVDLGSFAAPVVAKTVRRFNTEFLVSPENATVDITRYVPLYINNTGNVPIDGISVERRITVTGRSVQEDAKTCAEWRAFAAEGRRSAIVDCRQWLASQPAPAGTLSPLTALSTEVNPSADLFWKAPERANFLVAVSAKARVGGQDIVSSSDRRVSAFATYLFDDIEGGLRGESDSGSWVFGPGWGGAKPGFRSEESYGFGDASLGRYLADANSSLVSPTIDLGSARTARLGFYHNFAFEPSFDGGLIEASADGGKTWSRIKPIDDARTSASYNLSHPIQPASNLHPDHDPATKSYAFTSSSSRLPSSVDGWVLTQADLTAFDAVTARDVAYEAYGAAEMGRYGVSETLPRVGPNVYFVEGWCPGSISAQRCWEVQNVTQGTIYAPTPPKKGEKTNTFWWSGSASVMDDGMRPLRNQVLEFDVNFADVADDEVVVAEWWEYASRFNAYSKYRIGGTETGFPVSSLYSAHFFQNVDAESPTHRFNLGDPVIVETNGSWYKMRSDLRPILTVLQERSLKESPEDDMILTVGFAYTPVRCNSPSSDPDIASNASTPCPDGGGLRTNYWNGVLDDDPGFAIDDFSITATRFARGKPLGPPRVLVNEETAWTNKVVSDCGAGGSSPGTEIACLTNGPQWAPVRNTLPAITDAPGRTWTLTSVLPGAPASWVVVPVRDQDGHTRAAPLPTGDAPVAWYTGDLRCPSIIGGQDAPAGFICPRPGSEARLVTPAIDLARVAGESASFSFWHRYGFKQYLANGATLPFSSGGVIEMQTYDAQTGTWGPWKQLYNQPLLEGPSPTVARTGAFRGGYSAVTANTTTGDGGFTLRFDPPFETVRAADTGRPVQFLYSGSSMNVERAALGLPANSRVDGWIQETFDVSEHLGKKVRFGFHYAFSDRHLAEQTALNDADLLDNPDGVVNTVDTVTLRDDLGGWWIGDVAIVGDVLVGKPVQLRWRAGTDGNVHDGKWQLDDIGLFGSRYSNNVGVFTDQTEKKFGATNATNGTVPVTIRNLGDTVRRNLVVEVRQTEPSVRLTLSSNWTGGTSVTADGNLIIRNITLAPGASLTIDVKVGTPRQLALDATSLLFQLKQFDPTSTAPDPYIRILDNEVQGFLSSEVAFHLQRLPEAEFVSAALQQSSPRLGEPVDLVLRVFNPGFTPAPLNLSCAARTVTGWEKVNHVSEGSAERPVVAATYPCALVSGNLTLPAKGWTNLTYRATPTAAGFLSFVVKGNVTGGTILPDQVAGLAVGVSDLAFSTDFDFRADALNFTNARGWNHLRGNVRPGALEIGLEENQSLQGGNYYAFCNTTYCVAESPFMDLHNYSEQTPAFLSFWHQERLARHDGAQVRAQIVLNELRPTLPNSVSRECILHPIGGYEGAVRQVNPNPAAGNLGDQNGAFQIEPYNRVPRPVDQTDTLAPEFFITDAGGWEEKWTLSTFRLDTGCVSVDSPAHDPIIMPLVGHTVRFKFYVFPGNPSASLMRGPGHAWLIDDITIGPHAVSVRPTLPQRASLVDNTTKTFHVVVENLGSVPDAVTLRYDAINSSAPAGSVSIDSTPVFLAPGGSTILAVNVTLPRDPSLLPTDFKVRVIAQSIFDPNAAGATVIDVAFGPRQWAELALSVIPPAGLVQEGTDAFFPVTVQNLGLVDSVQTKVRVTDVWAGGNLTYDLDLGPMPGYARSPDEALRLLEFVWRPLKGSVGVHNLTFVVDPDGLGEEYTLSNNRVSLQVQVIDLLIPDLAIGNFSALSIRNSVGGAVSPAFDADVARYEVTAGELVGFDLRVSNVGRSGATNVDVIMSLGDLNLPSKTIPYIGPGGEVVVSFNWLSQKGEHEIEFLVRSDQVDISTANNRFPARGVAILTVKGYEVAVDIPDVEGLLEPGAIDIAVPFRVVNSGNAGEDLLLVAKAPAGMHIALPRQGFFLRAGETYEDTARLRLDAEAVAGEQFITIDAVARENPMKVAHGRAALEVKASYGGSVVGGLTLGAPPEATLSVTLVNEGNSLVPWTVNFQLPAGWTSKETLPLKVVVPAHDKKTVDLRVGIPPTTAPGDRVVGVSATMANGEKRNDTLRVHVLPLRAAGVVIQDETPAPTRGSIAIPIMVENQGNVQKPFSVLLLDSPPGVEFRVEPAVFDLPPGGQAVAKLIVRPNDSIEAGTYPITTYTRFEGVVPQTREGLANVQSLRVPIVRQDLRVAQIEFSPRAELEAGDRVTVKVAVQNRGLTGLLDVPVHLYVDDVFVDEVRIPVLAAGARQDVTFNWTALDGVHTLTAVVDPDEDTVDTDRADNAVSALASVGGDPDGAGGVAAGRANTPFPGVLALLVAIVVALLVIPGKGSRRQRR